MNTAFAKRVVFWSVAPLVAFGLLGFLLQWMAGQGIGFFDWWFYGEVALTGLLVGVRYSLVALGFVLIFKASGVFNFAQGSMVLFAALTFVGLLENGVPIWGALPITLLVMWLLAVVIERVVLRPLVNQEHIILFMATIGIFYLLEGGGQLLWGSQVRVLDIGLPSGRIQLFGGSIQLQEFELVTAAIAGLLVAVLAVFFNKTRVCRALRAVADDHQAALSVGIPLKAIWVIVWTVAGIVALVAGITWGSDLGVQPTLALTALKALPVLILGGFTSIPGAIIGGLIIGAGEQVGEVFFGSLVGGAIQDWFAYMLALVFLLFRPQGLFGERIIERV
jgi:branched-chain amino acid transport system permease protein